MRTNLYAPDSSREGGDFDEVTGQSFGTKRALHTNPIGSPTDAQLIELLLWGNTPEPNWDSISMAETSNSQTTYTFALSGSTQFTIEITGKNTNTPTATVVALQSLLKEDGDILLLESGDELLKETP